MTPATEGWITLAIQIPLVGIFVWFSLQVITVFTKSIDARDQQWRDFFNQQREANNDAINNMAIRFSDEIRALGKEVAQLRGRSLGNGD